VKRLLPALAVMLTIVAAVGTIASPVGAQRMGAITGIWASVFGANIYLSTLGTGYFDVSAALNPLLHTWTLAVEEQFYLVFPIILLLAWPIGRVRNSRLGYLVAAIAVVAVSVSSFLLMWKTAAGHAVLGVSGPEFAFYASPARAWEFGAGALLALILPRVRRLPMLVGSALGAAGFGLIVIAAAPIVGQADFNPGAALLAVAGTCALLAAGGAPANLVSRALAIRPAVWIGNLSYSWYLWHWPLIVFALALWPATGWAAPAAAALSLLPAWLSYRFVENPIRLVPQIRIRALVALAAGCIAVPIAASLLLVAVHRALASTSSLQSWTRVERLHADVVRGCNDPTPLGLRTSSRCSWHVSRAKGTVVLVGDSNAGQFTEPVVRAARHARYDAVVVTLSSCPFVELRVDSGTGTFRDVCRRFVSETLATLVRLRPSLVIMAARSDGYIENAETGLGPPAGENTVHGASAKARLWQKGIGSVLATLNRAGVPAVVVHALPELPADSAASAVILILERASPSSSLRSAVDRRLRRSLVAENRAIAAAKAAWGLDVENAVCGAARCSSTLGGHFMYRDGEHLSVDGALTLTRPFYDALVAHARPVQRRKSRPQSVERVF
jgi:peptidoglycan/LPS O-acetylase OafA/YrhL